MTSAPPTLQDLQNRLSASVGTSNLGIVGDRVHIATGGYHIGAQSLRANGMSNDYSLEYALDKNANDDFACAVDIGGPASLLMVLGNRIVHALANHDPRVYGRIRGVNAPFDGQSIDRRLDDENPDTASDDNIQTSSDRNHIHIEVYRTLVTNQNIINDLYSVLTGEGSPAPTAPPVAVPASSNPIHGMAVPALIRQGSGQYLGSIDGPNASHGGYNANEQSIVALWEKFLIWDGDVPGHANINDGWADGIFDTRGGGVGRGPASQATANYQRKHRPNNTSAWGQVWWDDWTTASQL